MVGNQFSHTLSVLILCGLDMYEVNIRGLNLQSCCVLTKHFPLTSQKKYVSGTDHPANLGDEIII